MRIFSEMQKKMDIPLTKRGLIEIIALAFGGGD